MNPAKAQSQLSQPTPSVDASSTAAPKTAKLFKNGRSQAVRLPKEFRFEGSEVAIRRNPATGEVVIAPIAPEPTLSFDEWFALYDALPDDASEEEYAKLPPAPRDLTNEQMFKIIESANFPADFMADRKTSMPRNLDIF
jgi:antitoxin VapB